MKKKKHVSIRRYCFEAVSYFLRNQIIMGPTVGI